MPQELQGFVVLTFEFHREGRLWVGECLELGTATDGRSLPRVEKELAALVSIHLQGLDAIGERERLFSERGIKLYTDNVPPTVERTVPVSTDAKLIQFRPVPVSEARSSALVP